MARHQLPKPTLSFICGLVAWLCISQAAWALSYYNIRAADVTATSFTLVWQTDYPAKPNIQLYSDVSGLVPVTSAAIEPSFTDTNNQNLADAAESSGVMRVRISGLNPATPYFYRLVTQSNSIQELFPTEGALPSVVTAKYSIPYGNESLATTIYQPDGSST